uniref:Mucin 5B, oligomeric mucus/gel-forming n=1 Tax=Rhinopithecus roxellana TaxID=61622 RepID=A0A2K6PXU8_RHIRO
RPRVLPLGSLLITGRLGGWGVNQAGHSQQPTMGFSAPKTRAPQPRGGYPVGALNPAHNGRVCSTWGDFHYKTFDGDVFRFPGLCNYVFSEHCGAAYEDFNVQLRRGLVGSRPVVTRVVIKAQGLVLEASNGSVLVNGQREELPYSRTGLLVEQSGDYVKVSIRLVLTFLWNGEDSALLELDPKYANQTCGLCGDFNGLPAFNEFYAHNARLTPLQFGNLQKLDGPTEQCPDPLPLPASNCTDEEGICHHTLLGPAFAECHALVDSAPYLAACAQDLCRCPTCPCATFVEYSRQCAHAGGQPQNWRRPELCPRTCPVNMQHQECGSPCVDTCSNPQRAQLCEDHCVDGCFCPPGTVLDDVTHSGCLPLEQCPCTHGGHTYSPGASVNTTCSSCTCSGGLWQCQDLPCPGTCSVQGGAHISTYDEKLYDLHGDCSYVLSKKCADSSFTVLAELRKCGLTDNENCLKAVTLSLDSGDTAIRVQADGSVFLNSIYTQLPLSAANITLFTPSSFFIVVHTGLGLQLLVQLVPLMQVFVRLDPAHQGQMCGLCGNFNQNQADDFTALSGVVEATGAAFANTWKAQAACANARNSFEDPCSLSVENENYARHWCSRLTDPTGSFSRCHSVINPKPFHSNCLFDTCNCERSEDCLCAALSSYVHACAAKGMQLSGWRDGICTKYMQNCPKSQRYAYVVDACQPTCRGLSEADVTCSVSFVPVDGCTCPMGTFLNDVGACVPARECPCYVHGTVLAPGEVVHDEGAVCSCEGGKLSCLGASLQKSTGKCHPRPTLPETIRVDCNTCTCRNRRWECSHRLCLGTCVAYGDGHFITFDGERYTFEGSCEYILAQDYCGDNATHGTFRIVTENIPCGTTGTTCSKAIKLFVESYELILQEGAFKAVARGPGGDPPYKIRYMGIFLVIETRWMAVSWDRKTSVFIRLHQDYKGRVCGLCGNFDDHAINDFATRSRSVVGDTLEFGNSWKLSPSCPDALAPKDPCTANPFRKSWAQKQCSILHGPTFAACRSQVDSTKYYEACVNDACACDSGGDCECFCTAVAAYAQACHDAGLCVSWRTPDTCPLFCDFYNPHGGCEWHYQPCGAPCLKTCRNPSGHCLVDLPGLEGCYPKCPPSQPFFNEDQMKCVAQCGCYDRDGNYYDIGARVPTAENCQSCNCTPSGIQCAHTLEACTCTYEDRTYGYQDVIYNTTDGLGACLIAICGSNGTIVRKAVACPGTPATTPFTFTTSWVPHSTTSPALPVSTVCVREVCHWSSWYNGHHPEPGLGGGDFETFENLRQRGYQVCPVPADIECRAGQLPDMPLGELGQQVDCDRVRGLMCANSQQSPPLCHDYELRVLCCEYVPCGPSLAPGTSPQPSLSASTEPAVPTPTQTTATEKTTLWVIPSIRSTAALTSQTGSSSGPTTVTSLAPGTTTCQPRCQWTEWFDEDYPKSEQLGGDVESYDKIRAAGGHLCEQPKDIECQAESFPHWPLAQVGQKVHCDVRFGLVCRNWEQEGIFKMCYNYRIRVLCCSTDHCRGRATTPPPATELETATTTTTTQVLFSTLQSTSSLGVTSTTVVPTLSKGLTSPRYTGTLGTATTGGPTVPAGSTEPTVPGVATSSLPTRSVLPGTTRSSGTWHPSQPPTPAPTTTATSRAHLTGTASSGSKQPLTTSLAPTLSSELLTSQAETSTPRTETTLSPLIEATTSQSTTHCQPKCEWTEWFDVDFPTSGVAGGDMETFENIRAAGGKMCWAPKSIECRAENYPEVSIDQIGQVLTCSLETGLICKNEDQTGRFNMCFNYNVRVLCCDDYSQCPPGTTGTTLGGTTLILTEPTTKATVTMPTGSMATASSTTPSPTPATAATPNVLTTMTTTPTVTGSKATPSSSPGTAPTLPALTSTATTPTATSFTAIPSSSLGTTWTLTAQTTTPTATMSTARPSSTSETAHIFTGLTTMATTTGATGSMATASSSPGTAHTTKVLTTTTMGFTATPSSSPGTARTLPVQIRTNTTPTTRGSRVTPSSIPGTTHTPTVLTNTTTTVATGSMATPSSSPQTAGTPPALATTVTTITATGSTTTPSSTPGTTPISPVLTTTATTPAATSTTVAPSSALGTTHTPPVLSTTATTHGRSQLPESPRTVPTAQTSMATSGTTHITEPSTVTSHTPAGTTSTTSHSTPALSRPHTHSRTTESRPSPGKTTPGLTTATSRTTATATPSETHTSTLLPSSPTSAPTTPVVSTGCEPQCAWSDWLDYSYPMSGPSGGDLETYSNIRAAGGAICEQPLGLECRAQAQPGVPLRELGQVVECSLDVGLVCRNRQQVGKFKMCFNYEIRVFCCNYSHCPSTPAMATGSTAIPSSIPGTTQITKVFPTTAATTEATGTTGSTANYSSTPGTTWILTEPTTTLTTTVATGSTVTPSSTPATAATSELLTTTATKPTATGSKATPSTSPGTASTLPVVLTSTANTPTATSFTAIPSSSLRTTWNLTAQTTATTATQSTAHASSTPRTTHTSTALTTTATTTQATGSTATLFTSGTAHTSKVLTTMAITTSSTATPSSSPGTASTLTALITTNTTPTTSRSTVTPSSIPGTTHTPTVLTNTTTTVATGSMATPSSSPQTVAHKPITTAITTVATGSTTRPSSPPGTTRLLTEPTTTATITVATKPTTTAVTTVTTGSTAMPSSTPGMTEILTELTTTTITAVATGSTAMPSSTPGTARILTEPSTATITTVATGSTATPSSTLGTTGILTEPTTTAIPTVATGSTATPSSTLGTTRIHTEPTTTATITVATSSMTTSSSTLASTWILTEPSTTAITTVATSSTSTPSSSPGTITLLTEPTTAATITVATSSTATPSSTPGTTWILTEPSTTAITTVATGSTATPSATPETTGILTEPTTTATITVATGSTANPSSTPGTTGILTEPTTTITVATVTPSSTPATAATSELLTTTATKPTATGSKATPSTSPGTASTLPVVLTSTANTPTATSFTAIPSSSLRTTWNLTAQTTATTATQSTAHASSTPRTTHTSTALTTTTTTTQATGSTATLLTSGTPHTSKVLTTMAITTSSTATPSSSPGTASTLTALITTNTTPTTSRYTVTPSSIPGTTHTPTVLTNTTTTVATGSMATPSSSPQTVAHSSTATSSYTPGTTSILIEPITTAITTVATGSTTRPSSPPGTTRLLTEPTTTATITVATSSMATSSTQGTTSIFTEPTTTAVTTVTTGSTAMPSSTPGMTEILTELTTTTITAVATGSTAMPSSTPGTARILTEPSTATITTVATGSTATPSSTLGTTGILTEPTTTAIPTVATGSTATPSSTLGTTRIHTEPTTTATITVATSSMATPSSTLASTWILTEPSTTAITTVATKPTTAATITVATSSTATPSSTPGTTWILTEPSTTAITTVATGSTATPSSTPGMTSILTEPTTTTITAVATGSTANPSSTPGTTGILTEPTSTAITTVATGSTATPSSTPGMTSILTEPTTTTITTVATGSTANPSSTPGTTSILTEPTTTAITTVATGSTATPASTPGMTSILTELTTTAITTVATGSMATPFSTRGTTGILTEPINTATITVATHSTATPSSTPGTTSILTEPITTAITTVATGSMTTPSSSPGTTRLLTEPTTTATVTVATSSMAMPSTQGTTLILTEPNTTAITTVATGSTVMTSSTLGTTGILTEPTTTTITTVATGSTATPSSTLGTTGILTEPTTTAITTVATRSTATPSSTSASTWILTEPSTTAITTVATGSTAIPSSTPRTTVIFTEPTTTATITVATSSTAIPSSTPGTTWILTEPTTLATPTEATGSTATIPRVPGTAGTLPVQTTTATTTMASRSTAIPSSTVRTARTPKVLTTTAPRPTATGSTVPRSSTLGTTHTPAVLPSSLPAFSVSTVSSSVLTTLRPTHFPSSHFSTPCFCRAFGQFFSPGEVIYNRTDRAGCQFYAVCNQHCGLDRFQGTCPTSPPPASSTPLPSPSPAPGCDNANPPRQVNETWTLENCTVAKCVGDNRVALLDPKPVANVTCVNKHLPIKVSDPSQPCDFHYECECICSVWSSSHYSTFDGTSYTFRGNCTYVLMREIHARLGNLSLYLDNHYCAAATASCSRALSIHYKSMDIVLTVTMVHGKEEDLILFDQIPVSSGFSKNGVLVSVTGTTTMRVDIPALGVSVTFDGHVFQARLPYGLFHNNTEGQCGTCTNNQRDDCLQRDGTTAASCKDMAKTWLVPDSRKDGCWAPTGTPPTASPPAPVSSAPTPSPCPPQPLCDLMLSQVFAECHDLVPPGPFFNACISDGCQGRPEVPCQSLEAYAALCRARGVCSDWRGATGSLCDLTCPPTKVYKPCGPIQPASCNSRNQNPQLEGLAEGCFCPEDQILFSAHTDTCVQSCALKDPLNPFQPGQQWISNCQSCVCDEGSVSVQCKPLPCEAQGQPPPCSHPGFMTVTRPRADNPCCPETVCVCNTTTCHQSPPVCPLGQELISTQKEGDCCPTLLCSERGWGGTGVGATFPGALPCHMCTCLSGDTQDPAVQCQEDACHNTTCPQGFEYKSVAGQCCGECVQTACLTPGGPPVQLNETWVNSRVDNCTVYHCEVESGVYLLTPQPASCPDVSSCRGSLRKTGCCYSCEEDFCQVRVNTTVLWHQGCRTEVNITFCEGSCPGESKYSAEAQAMQHQCTCCQERRVHEETVLLHCPDGSTVLHTYNHVDECGCTPFCVPAPMAPTYPPGFLAQEATAV